MQIKGLKMNRSDVLNAEEQKREQKVVEEKEKCTVQYVLSADVKQKCHSNLQVIDRFTVEIAMRINN